MEILRWPKGGMNTDDSIEILDPDDWSYAANIVDGRSANGKNGEKENIKGTTLIDASPWTDSNSVFIGGIRSAEADVNYLFFYNSDPAKHCILKLSEQIVLTLVIQWSGLNFQNGKYARINGGGIAENLLYFTDNYNQPRCIHTTRYAVSNPASEEEILHIKRGPIFPPTLQLNTTATTGTKPVDDVQLAYQYEYADGQLSVISPWSYMVRGGLAGVTGVIKSVGVYVNPFLETIPVLVTNVKFVARRGNTGTPFYIGDLSPADAILLLSPFIYKEQNVGVLESIYTKAEDLVPLTAKCSSITKSRAWFGNYVEGYDVPPQADVTLTAAFENIAGTTGAAFSPNSRFKLGVHFMDAEGRSCGVLEKGTIETQVAVLPNASRQWLKYRITGTPPAWATSYSLVISKDVTKSYFLQGWGISNSPDAQIYVDVTVAGVESYVLTMTSATRYLRLDMRILNALGVYYTFKEGDYAIVTNDGTGTSYGPLKVMKTSGVFVYVEAANIGAGALTYNFQIYTPNNNAETLYYEAVGQLVSRRKIVAGVMDTTDFYIDGDCINYNVQTPSGGSPYYFAEMKSRPQDFTWNTDIGKPYVTSNIGQANKKNFIRYSSPFIAESNINGLSEFNTGDESNVPIEAVEIQKLQPTMREQSDGDVLLALCNSNVYSVYLDEARMSTNDTSFLVASARVIGDVRKQRSGFGTLHPESVLEEDGQVFFYDILSRAFCRYASNGIFPVSEYKVVDYFEDQSTLNLYTDLVFTGYDPFYKILFVTFATADTSTKKTIGFSLKKERWISFYDFAPDGYVVGSRNLYSIVDGQVYMHSSSTYNSFYGVVHDSVIDVSFNDAPDKTKEWKAIFLDMSPEFYGFSNAQQIVTTDALRVDLSNRHGQATSIRYNEFEVDENLIYGEIRGDENSTGGVLSGVPMYSNTLKCRTTFAGTSYKQLLMLKAGAEIGRGHQI